MPSKLTMGSLFDGSGTFPLASERAGITPVWASEIEPFPIRVTRKYFPNMKHLGDIRNIDGSRIEPVDIITGSSPCTQLSFAGTGGELEGAQSGLFYEMVRVIKEMSIATNRQYPRYFVWENVPGALWNKKGEDFDRSIKGFADIADIKIECAKPARWEKAGCLMADGFGIVWRMVDAQYWGVPNTVVESSLLDILESEELTRSFYLSARGCQGIIDRALRKKRRLPEPLWKALLKQAAG